jgi:CheY-specific phosphatase CheX
MPEKFSVAFVAATLGAPAEELTPQGFADGVGELVHMAAGGAKRSLSGSGTSFDLSLPSFCARSRR